VFSYKEPGVRADLSGGGEKKKGRIGLGVCGKRRGEMGEPFPLISFTKISMLLLSNRKKRGKENRRKRSAESRSRLPGRKDSLGDNRRRGEKGVSSGGGRLFLRRKGGKEKMGHLDRRSPFAPEAFREGKRRTETSERKGKGGITFNWQG